MSYDKQNLLNKYKDLFDKLGPMSTICNNKFIITLCGSGRFYEDFIRVEQELTELGLLVFKPAYYYHTRDKEYLNSRAANEPNFDIGEFLGDIQKVHFAKIAISDAVFIVDPGGYIGDATRAEIDAANDYKIPVAYLEPLTV